MVLLMSRQLTATGLRLSTTELKLQPATKETPMPTVSDFFPSKYLSAADLKGTTLHATIDKITTEEFENDGRRQTKPVITFREKN